MTPVWVTILVGLASGVVGTLLSTLLRITHERAAELRTRMLEAADDFVRAVDDATQLIDEAAFPQVSTSFFQHESELATEYAANADATREAAYAAVRAVSGHRPRIRLLYRPESATSSHAERAYEQAGEALGYLYRFHTDEPDDAVTDDERRDQFLDSVRHHTDEARTALDDFSREARDDRRRLRS